MIPRSLIILFVFLVGATTVLLVFLFSLSEDESAEDENKFVLRNGVYSHLDKLCRDVNSLDKIQIAVYFLMQSWLKVCDNTPDTPLWAPLKFMKKKIHEAVNKKIHDFNKQEERTVEDCIVEYYKTEILPTKDDFHQMLFELVLQAYVNAFNGDVDESGEFLILETIKCNKTASCQYSFKKPPPINSIFFEKIMKKNTEVKDIEIKEKKCVQVFHYIYLWNEKIRNPEAFDWAYYLLFRGFQTALNITDDEIKQHLLCYSSKMEEMEVAMKGNEDEIDPFIMAFLRERDIEIEILEDEIEYAPEEKKQDLENLLNLQNVLTELVINTYVEVFNIQPQDGKIIITSASGKPFEVEVPPKDQTPYL